MHIIPLGYEFDRVVKPFLGESGFRANRVYLLSSIPPVPAPAEVSKKHLIYANRVQAELEKIGITVIQVPANLIELLELIKTISNIVRKEKRHGNLVYINMSGAGRLTSVASTIVGMVHDVRVYYVGSDGYSDDDPRMNTHGYSIIDDKAKISFMENFQINMPNTLQLTALIAIMNAGQMRTVQLIEHLGSNGFSEYDVEYDTLNRSQKTKLIMRLNRNVIDKLHKMGYITKEKLGRQNDISITETGKYIANISGIA